MSNNDNEGKLRKLVKEETKNYLDLESISLQVFSEIKSTFNEEIHKYIRFYTIILALLGLIGYQEIRQNISQQIDQKVVEPAINMRISNIIDYELKNVENKILELEMSAKSLENIVKDVSAIYFYTTFISKREHDGTTLKVEDICKLVVDFTEEECINVANILRTKGYKHFKDIKGQINMDTIISN